MRRCRIGLMLFLTSLAAFTADAKANATIPSPKYAAAMLPVSTRSPRARKLFEHAMKNMEFIRQAEALDDLRNASRADPTFAQSLIMICHLSSEPEEQISSCKRAMQLESKVNYSERLLIRWLAGAHESNYVPAIAAMNDLLSKYPRDQRLGFLAGRWLVHQERYTQAIVVLERAVTLSPNYPAAINELGYAYGYSGDFNNAFAMMERYVALQPTQPNPYDSYGELLRLAGKFDAALQRYRMSVKLDPGFGSELGIADTYALMGKEEEARQEYARAKLFVKSENHRVEYELYSAFTFIREDDQKQAKVALLDVSKHAHAIGNGRLEAEAHRVLAMYEPDYEAAAKQLLAAEEALDEGHQISKSDFYDEEAGILRVRVARASAAQTMDVASNALGMLETMAERSRSPVIQTSYHAAVGALLMAEHKYAGAIPHLQEDSQSPLSMQLLWRAYVASGALPEARVVETRLATLNVPTAEQALVVPQFRASLVSQAGLPQR